MGDKLKVELTEKEFELITKALSNMGSKCFGAKLRAERMNYKKSIKDHYDREGRESTAIIQQIRKQTGIF